jgi:uncharacterized membrane protein YqjE
MEEANDHVPRLSLLARRIAAAGLGALQSRGELLLVEWQLEKARLTELLMLSFGLGFLGIMAMMLLTATIIFLFPDNARLYAAAGFALLYLAGAVWVVFGIRSLVKREPFEETVQQLKKDRECLDSFR